MILVCVVGEEGDAHDGAESHRALESVFCVLVARPPSPLIFSRLARSFKYLLKQSGMLDFFRGGLFEIGEEETVRLLDCCVCATTAGRRSRRRRHRDERRDLEGAPPQPSKTRSRTTMTFRQIF